MYSLSSEREEINKLIEESILDAEKMEAKVISLGLLNQKEDLNGGGDLFLKRNKNLRVRIVDGSSLAVAVVFNSIPMEGREVFFCGGDSKIGRAILCGLSERRIRIQILTETSQQFDKIKMTIPSQFQQNITRASNYQEGNNCKIWIVGKLVSREDQMKAPKGALFVQFEPFPIRKARKDCTYYTTLAMRVPENMENVHACENWLPRGVMSAWRVGGIVHALEGWDEHECGHIIHSAHVARAWEAALKHGFLPFPSKI